MIRLTSSNDLPSTSSLSTSITTISYIPRFL
nr:MAG TPA: hypothetical protein [Caudoviricetes sp.]